MSSVLRRLSDTIGQLPRKHEGIRHNIRLGLLGFGGSGFLSQPHVYTIQGWVRQCQSTMGQNLIYLIKLI